MAAIQLTGEPGLDVTVVPSGLSSFTKYLENPDTIHTVLAGDPLPSGSADLSLAELSFQHPFDFAAGGVHLTVSPKLLATIAIAQGAFLSKPAEDSFGDSIPIPPGQIYISLCIRASIGVDGTGKENDLQFGFGDQSQIAITNYRLFPLHSPPAPAIQALLQNFTIPADLTDIRSLEEGSVASVEGSGSLKVTTEADLPVGVNPLASVTESVLGGALSARAGGTVGIKASYTITGDYKIRIQRLADRRFQLGFAKGPSSEFNVSVEAQAGASVTAQGKDLIGALLQAVSSDPAADSALLTGDRKSAVEAALKAGIERSLQLSVNAELDLLDRDSTAFSYVIDADSLNAAGAQAVMNALRGDLTEIEKATHAGVKPIRSILTNLRQRKEVLRLNLLGIFNFASVGSLLRNGTVIVDRETGRITIADKTAATRVGFASDNFAKDGAKLRKTLAESLLITASYRVGGGISSEEFGASQWFYELHDKTSLKQVRHYLNIARALGIGAPAGKAIPASFGPSQFLVDLQMNDALFRSLFLNSAHEARPRQEYEDIAKIAMLALLPAGETSNDARRLPLANADVWMQMKDKGQPNNFGGVLERYHFNPNQLGDIDADYTLINWWAGAMHRMAMALEAILKYLAWKTSLDPNDNTLKRLRSALNHATASVDQDTTNEFAEPFGLIALDLASGQKAAIDLHVASPGFSFAASRQAIVI